MNNRWATARHCRLGRGSTLAEFGPALAVLFIIFIFPLINLVGFGVSAATVAFIALQTASAAATTNDYDSALSALSNTANNLLNSPVGRFAKIVPVSGYNNIGTDLYIAVTNLGTTQTSFYGPNTALTGTVDTTHNVYEYEARSNYLISPLLDMSGVPFVGSIPGIGQQAGFSFTVQRAVEFPDGLSGTPITATDYFPVISAPPTDIPPVSTYSGSGGGSGPMPPPPPAF